MSTCAYPGTELALFAQATNWKAYLRTCLAPFVRGDVLEVGAGLGGTTRVLCDGTQSSWLCLEPDAQLASELGQAIASGSLPAGCRVQAGTLADVAPGPRFDTLLYVDVVEHIEDDRAELHRAMQCLKPGGHLVVVVPAHPFLYSPFDEAIGHYRRYTRRSLLEAAPTGLPLVQVRYLDSVGLLASVGNRLLLRSAHPTSQQIALWDGWMVPMSRRLDGLLRYGMGKSLLAIWRR